MRQAGAAGIVSFVLLAIGNFIAPLWDIPATNAPATEFARYARDTLGDRLVGVTVEVERQHRALELREHARQTRDEAVQLLARDHLVDRVVRRRAGQHLVEGRLRVAGRGGR